MFIVNPRSPGVMVGDVSLVSHLNPEIPLTLFKPKHPLRQVVSTFSQRIVNNINIVLDTVVLVILHANIANIGNNI